MTSSATATDVEWMKRAIELAKLCPPAEGAYSVGAIIVDNETGEVIASGYSRETDDKVHAEESALAKVPGDPRLKSSTIYSTLEPCSQRASRPKPCAQLVLEAGIPRVVVAWREPALFVANCVGLEQLEEAGVEVIEIPELADSAKAVNGHLSI
jgi:diaminohydroxyphosphoribosylaminopyrimidine deaminase/5-amino-6-(5-phosphoribosylamino)uracil reductase